MEILLNELSLDGQFPDIDAFNQEGLIPILYIFKELEDEDIILKKYQFYQSKVTPDKTLEECLRNPNKDDTITRFKSFLAKLIVEPFWEAEPIHPKVDEYLFNQKDVFDTSLAEACERDKIIISFKHDDFLASHLTILRNSQGITIDNLTKKGEYTDLSWQRKTISIEKYCHKKYNGKSKLDFSRIDIKKGFDLLTNDRDKNLFLDAFRKFNELDWTQIHVDDALDYKKYNNSKQYFSRIPNTIYKFRASEKYRCFGYVEKEVFYVLRFDLSHELSDSG